MATRREILEQNLPQEVVEKVMNNAYPPSIKDFLNEESDGCMSKPSTIVSGAFPWYKSPEGHEYWKGICDDLKTKGV